MGDWYHCTFAPISSPSQTQTIYLHSTSWDSLSDRSRDSLSDRSRNSFRTDLGTDGGRLFITRYSVLLLHILRLVHLFFLFVLSHFNVSRLRCVIYNESRRREKIVREIVCN